MTMTKAVRMRGTRLLAEALRSEWERRARALGGAFLAVFNHHSGKAAGQDQAPRAEPPRPAESEAMREARLSAREHRVKTEMRKRNEFIPRDDSPTGQINAWNPFLPESESPAAKVSAKRNPFLPKDTDTDGRNPFLPK